MWDVNDVAKCDLSCVSDVSDVNDVNDFDFDPVCRAAAHLGHRK